MKKQLYHMSLFLFLSGFHWDDIVQKVLSKYGGFGKKLKKEGDGHKGGLPIEGGNSQIRSFHEATRASSMDATSGLTVDLTSVLLTTTATATQSNFLV